MLSKMSFQKEFNKLFIILVLLFSYGMICPGCNDDSDNTGIATPADQSSAGENDENNEEEPNNTNLDSPTDIKLVFAGDIMLARDVEDIVKDEGNGDYGFPFAYVKYYLNNADIVFANLESVISDKGMLNIFTFPPWFRAKPEAVDGLITAGIDVVSVANNHIFDYGRSAMEDSFTRLKNAGIDYAGGGFNHDEAYSPVIRSVIREDVKVKKIAYLAFTHIGSELWSANNESTSGIAWLTLESLESSIQKAKDAGADIIIVSMHFGAEYSSLPNDAQDKYAHRAIDRGADLVIGHHPHVTQPVMVYAEKYIAYSLGNFVFDQDDLQARRGMLLEVIFNLDGEFVEVNPVYYTLNEYYQPVFD